MIDAKDIPEEKRGFCEQEEEEEEVVDPSDASGQACNKDNNKVGQSINVSKHIPVLHSP